MFLIMISMNNYIFYRMAWFYTAFLFCLFPKHRHKILNKIKLITHDNSFFLIKFGAAFVNNIYFCLIFIFVYQKSLKRTFPTSFWVQNHPMNLYSCEFTMITFQSKSWCEMFVLKLSGIQNQFYQCTEYIKISCVCKLLENVL